MHEPIPKHDVALPKAIGRRELVGLGVRWTLGVVAFMALMLGVAEWLRTPLESLGRTFVARFGYAGMTFGTFLADGFHFPIPPQFYMLLAVSSGAPELATLGAIACGSLPGGLVGYVVGRRLAAVPSISRKLARSTAFVERFFRRFGYGAALLASLSPIPYSVLCAISGAHRLEWRFFALLSLCRLPRLVMFYWIVRASWGAS
ncbi:MAG TPA: VTT domain-containing protein [Polyangiaceae bacterium]